MVVRCECYVLSGRGHCDGLVTRPEESYRVWCVVVCDIETSSMRRPWPALGRSATEKKNGSAEGTYVCNCGLCIHLHIYFDIPGMWVYFTP
jgi:hypothetical protein